MSYIYNISRLRVKGINELSQYRNVHKNVLGTCGFYNNWSSKSPAFLRGCKLILYLYFPRLVSSLCEIQYKRSAHNVVKQW